MRILYLSEARLASDTANSIHVVRMAAALARQGHEVLLWGWRGALDDAELRSHYGLDDENLLIVRDPVGSGRPTGRIRRLLRRARDERRALRRLRRAWRPDLVYARNLFALLWTDRTTPTILESHAPATDRIRAAVERVVLSQARLRRLVLISSALRDLYSPEPPSALDVIVAHDAADDPAADGASVGPPPRVPGRPLRVGHVGHLYPGRGGELLSAVAARLPDVEFHLVGGTAQDIARLRPDAPANVVFHGQVPPSAVAAHYAAFDVLVGPYQRRVSVQGGGDTSRWMSPMKLFEYLSWGRPLVFSDLPVLREVLDGENAMLVPPDDVDAWVHAIARLRDDEVLAARLGTRARADFLADHTWDHRAARVLAGLGLAAD